MRNEPEVGGIGRLLGLKRVLAATVAVFALVSWGLTGEYLRNREMQKEIDTLEGRAAAMEKKNGELAEATERFDSKATIEREARLKLNLQKPGENVVVIRDAPSRPAEDPGTAAPDAGAAKKAGSNPSKWWHYFFP